ncbi:ArsR/SmtB family transcription factor [Cryptosporangium phraense]|uniref:Winged helix-turn-helix transcriptional regulator n=1 Tax=Cryptosporangium phraense TaxID=2593070 RepID=A0A545AK05_9ACTN|nr:metalloregulator ArsR/SmtB family transcription factor [Cryptosporangium phraense]TQS41075.1 winged helix-turn-helix transcriptional regulator [Cryptosporangium phraense]
MSVWEALGDPVRREILGLLREGDAAAGAIADRFAISRPAISRHLRVLREAGLVRSEADGHERIYRLQPDRLIEVDEWIRRVAPPRRIPAPADRLDAFETELRRGRRTKPKENRDDHRSAG